MADGASYLSRAFFGRRGVSMTLSSRWRSLNGGAPMTRYTLAFVLGATFVIVTASAVAARTNSRPSLKLSTEHASQVPTTERPMSPGTQWWAISSDRAIVLDEKGTRRADLEVGANPLPPVRSAD